MKARVVWRSPDDVAVVIGDRDLAELHPSRVQIEVTPDGYPAVLLRWDVDAFEAEFEDARAYLLGERDGRVDEVWVARD